MGGGFSQWFSHPFGPDLEELVQAYTRLMIDLLPPGRLWKLIGDTWLRRFFEGAAEELARAHERAQDLLRESFPDQAVELLADYEEELAMVPAIGDTEAVRRARVVARLVARQRVRPADYRQALAGLLGIADPADVEILEVTNAQARSTLHERDIYLFHIWTGTGDYDLVGAQALVAQIDHSHTVGRVYETKVMICDDPQSLVDRDLIGV